MGLCTSSSAMEAAVTRPIPCVVDRVEVRIVVAMLLKIFDNMVLGRVTRYIENAL